LNPTNLNTHPTFEIKASDESAGKLPWMNWFPTTKRQLLFWTLSLVAAVSATHFFDKKSEFMTRGSTPLIRSGAWGDLQEWDIRVEQPLEYAGFEKVTANGPFWVFGTLSQQAVHDLLVNCGCSDAQATGFLNSRIQGTGSVLILKPDPDAALSLSPEVRSKLYLALSQNPANRFQATPYFIPNGDVDAMFNDGQEADRRAASLVKKLLYVRNGFTYFSDPELVIKELKKDSLRSDFLKTLTSQNAVLARLLIRRNSDIDKPLNYWALSLHGVLMKDLRPLMEAEQRLPEGGSLSLVYLLPPLARDRLFSTPLPPKDGDSMLPDCHWTALNFFSATPDPRMSDNDFASKYIMENFYEISAPGVAGDLVLLLNQANRVVHSSVYLADDLVFTKNGRNYAQPWILMRIKHMVGNFSALEPMKVAYFRRKGI